MSHILTPVIMGALKWKNPLSTVLCPSWDKEYTWMSLRLPTLFEMLPVVYFGRSGSTSGYKSARPRGIIIGNTSRTNKIILNHFIIRMNPSSGNSTDKCSIAGLVELDTDLGKVFGRKIFLDNQGGRCYNDAALPSIKDVTV